MKEWIVNSKTGAKFATSILSMLLAILLFIITGDIFSSEAIDKERSKNNANTNIGVNLEDTTQLSDYDKIMASQELNADVSISAENPYTDFEQKDSSNIKKESYQDERMAQMIKEQNEAITKRKSNTEPILYERYAPPPYERNSTKDNKNRNYYIEDDKPSYTNIPKEVEKKRGFNTISSESNNTKEEEHKATKLAHKQAKAIIPVGQTLQNGTKVKIKLKEDFGDAKEGDIITGVARMNQSEFNIVFNGISQFGIEGTYYAYFNGIKGISFTDNQLRQELGDEARRQGGNVASDIVRRVPILGDLGSRLISRVGESSRSREVTLELMSGERLTIGE